MTTRSAVARSGADCAAGNSGLSPTPTSYFAAEAIGAATRTMPESTARLRTRARRRAGERIGERGPWSGVLRRMSARARQRLSAERPRCGEGDARSEPELEDVLRPGHPAVVEAARVGESGARVRPDRDRVGDVHAQHDPVHAGEALGDE